MDLDTVGKRIRDLRFRSGLSQVELSEKLTQEYDAPILQGTLSRLERSSRLPNAAVIRALAQILNTTTDYLLLLTDNPAPRSRWLVLSSPTAQSVAMQVDALPPEKQEEVLDIVDVLVRHHIKKKYAGSQGNPQ